MHQEIQNDSRSRATDAPEFSASACGKPRNSTWYRRFSSSILLAIVGVFVFGTAEAAKPPPKSPRDTQRPTVSITAPSPGSTVSGVIAVGVSATDNVGVTRVDFRVNGATVASLTGSPYTFSWNSGSVANGSVTLSAAAYDGAGNSSSASETVTVANTTSPPPPPPPDTQPPTVNITSPAAGSTVSGTVSVNTSATDNVGVARVDFRVNGATVASLTSSPYTFSWNSGTVANGSVTLSAAAYDAAGNSSSAAKTVTVANTTSPPPDTQPPTVSITSPAAGSSVSGTVSVNASASDNVGVARVNLLVNGTQVASSTTAPYTFNWNSTTVADGGVTLSATAYDAAGNSASASTNATVQNGGTTASGATYYVSSSSGSDANPGTQTAPWRTLAKIYSSRSLFRPGDSVLLKRGDTWVETFNIPNQPGASGTPITYGAYGSGALPTVDAQHLRTFAIYMDSGSHIVVRDLRAINATADGVRIVAAGGSISDVVVQGVLSEQNARFGFSVEATPGVTDVDALEYRDDVANLNGWAGFYAYHVSAGATGINYYASKATYNGQLSANHGFSAYYANNIHYHGVEAAFTNIDPATGLPNAYMSSGAEGHGIALDDSSANSSVEHSYSHGNAGAGLLVHDGSHNTASYNVIANNGTLGVVVNGGNIGSSNIAVVNNTIYGNSYAGIAAWKPVTGLTIENNIVVNNGTYGLAFTYDGVTNYTVATNLIFGNTLGWTNGYVDGATGTIQADPVFVAPASGNFSLQTSSPAINAGLTLGAPYQLGVAAGSVWPSGVLLKNQSLYWTVGSFVAP